MPDATRRLLVAASLGLLFLLPGCAAPTTSLEVEVRSSVHPAYDRIVLEVARVEVRRAADPPGAGDSSPSPTGNGSVGWVTVFDAPDGAPVVFDRGSKGGSRFSDANLRAASFEAVRLVVPEAWGEDASGERTEFDVPHEALVAMHEFHVLRNETTRLQVDIGWEEADPQPPGANGVVLRPVIAGVKARLDP